MSVWLVAGTPVRRPVPVHAPRDPAMRQALPLPGRTDVDQLPQHCCARTTEEEDPDA